MPRRVTTGSPPGGGSLRAAAALLALIGVVVLALLPVAPGRGQTPEDVASARSPAIVVATVGDWRPVTARAARRVAAAEARADRRRSIAARRTALRALRRSRTVRGALRRALLARRIDAPTHDRMRRQWWLAERALTRLRGRRHAELAVVMSVARGLAHRRRLSAQRLVPVLLTVQRNRELWTSGPFPAPGRRLTFAPDPVVFQYYAGRGLAIQPLATLGRANALARTCLQRDPRWTCRPAALRRVLDRMIALAVVREGVLAWEYLFAFGGGRPGWISGMTQATGAQALARGRRALDDPAYGLGARRALRALFRAPPYGVAVRARGGRRYAMYSFRPSLRILNGELQALIGVRDAAMLLNSRSAQRLYNRGERAARAAVRRFDTGAWSLYSERGRESTLGYHRLVTGFLRGMCERTRRGEYCATARRFARYEQEAPRIAPRVARATRVRRATPVVFWLSKVSTVRVTVLGPRGLVLRRTLSAPRGTHTVAWRPARPGRHRVRIAATGPGGTRGAVTRTVRVLRPPARQRRQRRGSVRRR